MLLKYKRDNNHAYIFRFIGELSKTAMHYRIVERPVFLALAELTRFMNAIRQHGMHLGFLYPEVAPTCQILGPREFSDRLAYTQMPIFPLPPLIDVLDGVDNISSADRSVVRANVLKNEATLKEYKRDISQKVGAFMDTVSGATNCLDNFLGFHLDMYAHCDGEMRDMMREKASNLFLPSYRGAVKGAFMSRTDRDKVDPAGLLDGSINKV